MAVDSHYSEIGPRSSVSDPDPLFFGGSDLDLLKNNGSQIQPPQKHAIFIFFSLVFSNIFPKLYIIIDQSFFDIN